MRWKIAVLVMLVMMGPSGLLAATYGQGYSSSYALVVGIDRYRHWPPLEYAVNDARQVAASLRSRGFRTIVLTDENATRLNILDKLETIKKSADVNSRVVIYFAGHGQTEDLPGGGERGYIVPVEADTYDWKDTMLSMNRLNDLIRQISAKHIFLAFDACYSGLGLTRAIKRHPERDSAYIRKMMQTRSIQILTAGSRSEQAIEAEGHGLFTEHLLAALSGTADINSDGYITATEIYATVRPGVTRQSYSRQTPQFGYIEGNGDIIFFNRAGKSKRTTILLESRIGGIDVWAGDARVGSRLPAGRHRLGVDAGQTVVMVKKGSQTLYRENVALRPDREFRIQLPAAGEIPQARQPFSMLTLAHPNIDNYSNSIAYDLDGDGREEIVTASGNRLCAMKVDGSLYWERKFDFPIVLNLIDAWKGQTAIGISGVFNKKVRLLLLDSRGETIWQNDGGVTPRHQATTAGRGKMSRLIDIDGDGSEEVVAIITADSGMISRGIVVYDGNGSELWRYATGVVPQNIVVWPKESGRPDIIVDTFSVSAGNHGLPDKTGDRQACVISIDGYGRTNWVAGLGGYYTGVRVLLPDTAGDGPRTLYAHKYTSHNLRADEGGIYKISRSGKILYRFDTDNSILSLVAGRSGSGPAEFLYASDNKGNLYKLDDRLNLLQKESATRNSSSREIRLVGVHDYDGDGVDDILMYSFDRLMPARNPLGEADSAAKRFYSNLEFEILSPDFSRSIKKISMGEKWRKRGGFAVKDLDRPNGPYYAFMALSEKITIFNY